VRLKIALSVPHNPIARVPINYNRWLVAAIYRWLSLSSKDYASFLHNKGHRLNGKSYKLFCFSQLFFPRKELKDGWLITDSDHALWLASSPLNEFIDHLLCGIGKEPQLTVQNLNLTVTKVESLPKPKLKPPVKFVCLSPITASVWESASARHPVRYLEPGERFVRALQLNAKRKYHLVTGRPPQDDRLTITFDKGYMGKKSRISKLIEYKGIKMRGVLCPFVAGGSQELVEIGYECGFGEKNSIGFGMVEVPER